MEFIKTCGFAPEQYDVFDNGKKIAYIRLRWGFLEATMPDFDGETIYEHQFENNWMGDFENDSERKKYLKLIEQKISEHLNKEKVKEED